LVVSEDKTMSMLIRDLAALAALASFVAMITLWSELIAHVV